MYTGSWSKSEQSLAHKSEPRTDESNFYELILADAHVLPTYLLYLCLPLSNGGALKLSSSSVTDGGCAISTWMDEYKSMCKYGIDRQTDIRLRNYESMSSNIQAYLGTWQDSRTDVLGQERHTKRASRRAACRTIKPDDPIYLVHLTTAPDGPSGNGGLMYPPGI